MTGAQNVHKPSQIGSERAQLLLKWDDELLLGGVILSEWSVFLIVDADTAFVAGADLAALLAAQAAMEAHLKYEYGGAAGSGFADLIDASTLTDELKSRLHEIRRYRNRWVHVRDPADDATLLEEPERHRAELGVMVTRAMRLLREVVFSVQFV